MIYTDDFKLEVASVIDDSIAKSEILNDKIEIGKYLKENAFKGIDSKVILECLNPNDLFINVSNETRKTKDFISTIFRKIWNKKNVSEKKTNKK